MTTDWFVVRQARSDLWMIAEPDHVVSWLYVGSERALLVDTGTGIVPIDGEPVLFPTSYLQLEGLIARVGREGRDAVAKYLEARQKDAESHTDSVKN